MIFHKRQNFGSDAMRRTSLFALLILTSFFSLNMASCAFFHQQNQQRKAEELYRQSVALSGKARYSEAIPLAENALAIREKIFGPDHPAVMFQRSSSTPGDPRLATLDR
jgi:hypothetical protein